jgi:hypothetical protein
MSKSWRDVLPVHPAAEMFPPLSPDELQALADDIKANGLQLKVVLWRDPEGKFVLLDGRNRLDAIEQAFGPIGDEGARDRLPDPNIFRTTAATDPYSYVLAVNLRRRHLTIEEKRDVIVALLKANPEKSNRQIAKAVDASHPHVAKVRAEAEESGDVETVSTVTDSLGRKQPSTKPYKTQRPWAQQIGPEEPDQVEPEEAESEQEQERKPAPWKPRRDPNVSFIKIVNTVAQIVQNADAYDPADLHTLGTRLAPLAAALIALGPEPEEGGR